MGDSALDCAKKLIDAGAYCIGANCSNIDPHQIATIISVLKSATTLPILAQPNAGKPKLRGEKTIFEMTPADFAKGIAECIDAGATLIGSCCGTAPDHIQAVKEMLEKNNIL